MWGRGVEWKWVEVSRGCGNMRQGKSRKIRKNTQKIPENPPSERKLTLCSNVLKDEILGIITSVARFEHCIACAGIHARDGTFSHRFTPALSRLETSHKIL